MEQHSLLPALVSEGRQLMSEADFARWSAELIAFINTLKAEPTKADIKVNEMANNSLFIPIGVIEEKLDYFFNGLWETKDFQWTVVVNEIACSLQLRVFHPKAGIWIERTGAGATQIQLRAEYEMVDGKRVKKPTDVLDVSKKIVNTVQKDLPHAKAEAIKNAAKSLGAIFGRNLNRGPEDANVEIESIDDAEIRIGSFDNQKDLLAYYMKLPNTMKSDKRIKKALKDQELFIKNNPKPEEDASAQG